MTKFFIFIFVYGKGCILLENRKVCVKCFSVAAYLKRSNETPTSI